MTAGKWMTLDAAFARAVEIEGAPGAAHHPFMSAIMTRRIRCKACRREAEHWGMDEDRFNEFEPSEEFWNEVHLRFSDGRITPRQSESRSDEEDFILPDGRVLQIEEWEIFIEAASFDQLFTRAGIAPAAPHARSGGRPSKHDWARASAVAAAYVAENDYPSRKSVLVEVMRACFADAGSCPDQREIERFASEMYAEKDRLRGQRGQTGFPRVSPPFTGD